MNFGCIGCGKMGYAIVSGIVSKNVFQKKNIFIYEVNEQLSKSLLNEGFNVVDSLEKLFSNCEVVLFAIKPQEAKNVIASISNIGKCKLALSIMAGVPISTISKLSPNLAIVRIMPNTCALIGESASSLCYNEFVTDELKTVARNIFGSIGKYVEIDESIMDEVIPIGGSFTAYAYLFMKSFIDSSVKRGIDEKTATTLVIQSMIGSAKMLEKYGDVDTLIKNVCSKGGTTLAGLYELENANFADSIDKCAISCANRSKELGKLS